MDKRQAVADSLWELLDKHGGKKIDDKSYVAYVCFCALGGMLLNLFGESKFDDWVKEIKLKNGH